MVLTITMNYEAAGEQRCFRVTEEDDTLWPDFYDYGEQLRRIFYSVLLW